MCEMGGPEEAATVRTAMHDFAFPDHPDGPLKAEFATLVESRGFAKKTKRSIKLCHRRPPPLAAPMSCASTTHPNHTCLHDASKSHLLENTRHTVCFCPFSR